MSAAPRNLDDARSRGERCPACGQLLTHLVEGRCPLCGTYIEEPAVTGEDHTPYAESEHYGRAAWWKMCKWVWSAGAGRLAHLSLMRRSSASRRFRRTNNYWVAAAVALAAFTLSGWHEVRGVADSSQRLAPGGKGWYRVASAPPPARMRNPDSGRTVELWWNPVQAVISAAVAKVAALLLGLLLPAMLAGGVEGSLDPAHKEQQRLGAAWHYGTAWALPLAPAGLILALLPVSWIAVVADWSVQPPEAWVYVASGVLVAFAVVFGWLYLVRLANTVPMRVRKKLSVYCGIWWPLLAAAMVVATVWGLIWFQRIIGPAFDLHW